MNSTQDDFAALPLSRAWQLFLASVAGLFLELMMIRWIGTEIRIFAYLQNTILVVCFLGLGMGCFTCRRSIHIRPTLLALLILTGAIALPLTRESLASISEHLSVLDDFLIWYHVNSSAEAAGQTAVGLAMTFVLMFILWQMFVPLGRLLGRLMDDHPSTIRAYSINVAGSLVGIWLFVLLSALYTAPVIWSLTAGLLMLAFLGKGRTRAVNLCLMAAVVVLSWLAGRGASAEQIVWSPYQKLVLRPWKEKLDSRQRYLITVNNVGYQGMFDLSEPVVRSNGEEGLDGPLLSQYDVPLMFHPRPDRVLIVGAGSGNDAAGAIRGGARQVTAVEIDPAITRMGRQCHPERPYDSAKVEIVHDDARSFFATTSKSFDVIIFGLLDSHTTTAMTNARLDHYVYTQESIARAYTLLADGGVMVLSFEAAKPYIADRMAGIIRDVAGQEPLTFRIPNNEVGWGGVMFVAGDQQVIAERLAQNSVLQDQIAQWQADQPVALTYSTPMTSDDWPYLYLKARRIPTLFYLLAAMMLGLGLFCSKRLRMPSLLTNWPRANLHFFFLGAAFLLLETQNISKAAVVLGNTWWVNAVIISGILVMILLANLVEATMPGKLSLTACLVGLVGSCLLLYFVDLARFGFLPYAAKAAIVGSLTTLPILFSGIVFIRSFTRVARKDLALGANLIGALVGGLLQSITFVIGIKALLLVVAALYLAAIAATPERVPTSRPDEDEDNREDESRPELAAEEPQVAETAVC